MVVSVDLKFQPTGTEDNKFQYTVPADFADNLVSIQAIDALRGEHETLPIEQIDAQQSGRNDTMLWFDIDIQDMVQRSKDSFVYLQVTEVHKRRKMAWPKEASILEK